MDIFPTSAPHSGDTFVAGWRKPPDKERQANKPCSGDTFCAAAMRLVMDGRSVTEGFTLGYKALAAIAAVRQVKSEFCVTIFEC